MPSGLQIWDDQGRAIIDTNTHVGRFMGAFSTGGSVSGSFTDTSIIGAQFFSFCPGNEGMYGGPYVTGDSSTGLITWIYEYTYSGTPPAPSPEELTHTIYYGVY